jgi:hypothetical protein
MSFDRLAALRLQRAIVAQHLAWLDAEIAAASSDPTPATPTAPVVTKLVTNPALAPVAAPSLSSPATPPAPAVATPVTSPVPEPSPDALAAANARADEIIAQYSTEGRFDPQSTRRGCILLASAVFLLGLAGAMFVYLLYYNK